MTEAEAVRRALPCPWCKETFLGMLSQNGAFRVRCGNTLKCDSIGPISSNPEDAVAKWNSALRPQKRKKAVLRRKKDHPNKVTMAEIQQAVVRGDFTPNEDERGFLANIWKWSQFGAWDLTEPQEKWLEKIWKKATGKG